MTKFKGITLNVLILIGVFALLILTQSCGTVSGIGQDIQDMSDWSKEKLTTTMEAQEVSENSWVEENYKGGDDNDKIVSKEIK